jgi:protein-S-isoprenylcysteine O-methyltransferase Ste14
MERVAVGLVVLFFAVAVVLRMAIQWRLTGATGFHGLSGKPGSLEWFAGALFGASTLSTAASPVLVWLGWLRPLELPGGRAEQFVGLALFAVGLAVTFAAQLGMGRSWRIGVSADETTALVNRGLFALVRNPIYSAMLLSFLGLALVLPTPLAFGVWLLVFLSIELQVRFVEEPSLSRLHGAAFARYLETVGRFVPGIGLARSPL